MPKTVDHEQRRTRLIDAVLRIVGRQGLPAVTMRAVAAEAEVSLRLVQYYFGTKGRLLHATLEFLERRSHERWAARVAALGPHHSSRALIEQFLAEALPTDDESRVFHLAWTSYAMLAMTDPELAEQSFVAGPDRLERHLADTLAHARARGELPEDLDPRVEAARLATLGHGLGTSVLIGQRDAEAATEVLHYHLDRILPAEDTPGTGGDAPAQGLPPRNLRTGR